MVSAYRYEKSLFLSSISWWWSLRAYITSSSYIYHLSISGKLLWDNFSAKSLNALLSFWIKAVHASSNQSICTYQKLELCGEFTNLVIHFNSLKYISFFYVCSYSPPRLWRCSYSWKMYLQIVLRQCHLAIH